MRSVSPQRCVHRTIDSSSNYDETSQKGVITEGITSFDLIIYVSGSQPECHKRFSTEPRNALKNIGPLLRIRNLFLENTTFSGRKSKNLRQIQGKEFFF